MYLVVSVRRNENYWHLRIRLRNDPLYLPTVRSLHVDIQHQAADRFFLENLKSFQPFTANMYGYSGRIEQALQ